MATLTVSRRLLRYSAAAVLALLLLAIVAIGGVIFAWATFAARQASLHGWHTSSPASEFVASDATPAYTFANYMAQEDKVFAELDTLISKDWASESVGKFCRYKPDSICNPATLLDRNWNRTYVLEAKAPIGGVLLLHGLSDAPYSLRDLGLRLHKAGYTVIGLRIPGHGTCPKALADVSWRDWIAAVRVAMTGLREKVPAGLPLIMAGYSNGGALCVNHVTEALTAGGIPTSPQPDALVLISPMIGITPMAKFTELYPLAAKISGEPKLSYAGIEPEIDPYKYSSWPISASLQAHRLTQHMEASITALAASGKMQNFPPVLTVQSAADSTVVAHRLIDILMDRLPPGRGELILFDVNRAPWIDGLITNDFEQHIRPRLTRTDLPFGLTFVTNKSPDSSETVSRTRRDGKLIETDLSASWPRGIFSLSHVAVAISPTDPVYGADEAGSPSRLPLGTLALRGENGLLAISSGLMIRMRFNPFYSWTEDRIMDWVSQQRAK